MPRVIIQGWFLLIRLPSPEKLFTLNWWCLRMRTNGGSSVSTMRYPESINKHPGGIKKYPSRNIRNRRRGLKNRHKFELWLFNNSYYCNTK